MLVSDLTVEVRNASFARVGQILPTDLVGFKAALRFNNVGAWSISLRANHPLVDTLRTAGSGLIVTGPTGVILSGPTLAAKSVKTADDPIGVWEITGTDDTIILAERLAYPTPATADVTAQTDAYDIRTGVAETIVKQYVNVNIGPSAPAARKISNLTVQTSAGLGGTVTGNARFDSLGILISDLLKSDGLGFDIVQVGTNLEFQVYQPVDRTGTIRMDIDNLRLAKSEYSYAVPSLTRAIVAGQGEGAARTLVEVSNTESIASETAWNRRIETFIDQRQTDDVTELTQAGTTKLAEGGFTRKGFDVVPTDDETMNYGEDWGLGDKVTVVIDSVEVGMTVTEVAIVVGDNGVMVGATVGDPDTVAITDVTGHLITTSNQLDERVSNLERNLTGGAAGVITVTVKNNTGSAMTMGQAVYISGSTGANLLISLAQANAESTSSKTLGLLMQDLANGEQGLVITEGSFSGLDTSARTAGETIWLSPTTPGGLVFGTANKPSYPNHMVFIGYVERVQSQNGSYYVKVQNGYENDELHDRLTYVSDTAPTSPNDFYYWFKSDEGAHFFRYNDTNSSQWVEPKNIAGFISNSSLTSLTNRVTALETADTSTNKSGLVPVIPTSVSVAGTSASVSSTGLISFTAVTSLSPNGCFTSAFTNYVVVYNIISASADNGLLVQFRTGTTTDGGASYRYAYREQLDGNAAVWSGGSSQTISRIGRTSSNGCGGEMVFYSPQNASTLTRVVGESMDSAYFGQGAAVWGVAKSHDGFTFTTNNTVTLTGTMQIYGYRV